MRVCGTTLERAWARAARPSSACAVDVSARCGQTTDMYLRLASAAAKRISTTRVRPVPADGADANDPEREEMCHSWLEIPSHAHPRRARRYHRNIPLPAPSSDESAPRFFSIVTTIAAVALPSHRFDPRGTRESEPGARSRGCVRRECGRLRESTVLLASLLSSLLEHRCVIVTTATLAQGGSAAVTTATAPRRP